jgi:hypothetical protein
MRESKLEKDAREYVEARGCQLIKFVSPGRRGWPDRLLLVPQEHSADDMARVCFIEFKAPGKYPEPVQLDIINDLRADGFDALWTDNMQRIENWMASYVEPQED